MGRNCRHKFTRHISTFSVVYKGLAVPSLPGEQPVSEQQLTERVSCIVCTFWSAVYFLQIAHCIEYHQFMQVATNSRFINDTILWIFEKLSSLQPCMCLREVAWTNLTKCSSPDISNIHVLIHFIIMLFVVGIRSHESQRLFFGYFFIHLLYPILETISPVPHDSMHAAHQLIEKSL